jgi:hypothetical protein
MDVCLLCVLSGRGLCDELITCPEKSYRLWCVVVCDQETSWTRGPYAVLGCSAKENNNSYNKTTILITLNMETTFITLYTTEAELLKKTVYLFPVTPH